MSGLIGHRGLLLRAAAATGTAYRYWRVNVTLNNGGSFVTLHDAQFRAELGGSDLTSPSTPIVASSQHATAPLSNLIDNSLVTSWSTNTASTGWFYVDLGTAQSLAQLVLTGPDSGFTNRGPRNFTVDGSDNASSWTTVQSFTAVTWVASETKAFAL
ncbi:discoidin domain-containing protein [Lysobacter sp. CA199]|uniref:discoidin domain-containing protein n=1 Tax=Lysobacter sp. CA199 TaxID=3455608 RepID=UPI003F8D4C56